jgi:hypothetical protein
VSERPILFSGPMVRAILAGTKTQTRRPLKEQPESVWGRGVALPGNPLGVRSDAYHVHARVAGEDRYIYCPYGVPGDRLWVRETHLLDPPIDGTWPSLGDTYASIQDIPERYRQPKHAIYHASCDWTDEQKARWRWRPSIFMPRWASRLTLEVTDIRAQRLQDISAEDAIAEGIAELVPPDNRGGGMTEGALAVAAAVTVATMARATRREFLRTALAASLGFNALRPGSDKLEPGPLARGPRPAELYRLLWDSINGRRAPWDSNPWVWAVTFRRCA